MNSDVGRVLANFGYLVLTKGIDFIIPLVLLPFLVNTLGIEGFGNLAFVLALGIYFTAFMQYGFNVTAVRDIARVRNDKAELSTTSCAYFAATILLCALASLLFCLLFILDSVVSNAYLYAACFVFCLSQALLPLWFFQGIERMEFVAITNTLIKVSSVICILMLVDGPSDAYLVPLIQGVCGFAGIALALVMIFKLNLICWSWPQVSSVQHKISIGWPAFVTQIAPTLYNNSSTFILGISASPAVVGMYAAALRIVDICNAVAFLMTNAALPFLARNQGAHRWIKWVMILCGLGLTGVLLIAAPWITTIFFTEDTATIAYLIQLLSPMILFIFVRFTFGHAYLMLFDRERVYQNVVLYCSVVAFGIAWIAIPKYQAEGAATIVVMASASMALLTAYYAYCRKKELHKEETLS